MAPCPASSMRRMKPGNTATFSLPPTSEFCNNPAGRRVWPRSIPARDSFPEKQIARRGELECANSSDALLMNIFCYPGILRRAALCSLLGIQAAFMPAFGFRPGIPLKNGAQDRSEIDLKLGDLFIEAKLTEGDFQTARCDLVHRYRDLDAVFDVGRLPDAERKILLLPIDSRSTGCARPRSLLCRPM